MKTIAFVAVTALAALSTPTLVAAEQCTTMTLMMKLLPLMSDPNAETCSSETGYTVYPFSGLPTDEQLSLICASAACTEVLASAVALNLPDCTIDHNGDSYNVKYELERYASLCGVSY